MVNETIKQFNNGAKQFLMHQTEEAANNVQRALQILGASSDPRQFDPGNKDIVEFFINLHRLLNELQSKSNLNWLAVTVLLEACKNPQMRESLISTYKFTPILTRLLTSQLSPERKINILQILQELTYGIKISWQESYLPVLISTLTKWIGGSEMDCISLSLGVLVNLCYKNSPAVYVLLRTIDVRKFLKTILKLQKQNDPSRIQVTKLFIILDGVSDGIPESEVHSFVKSTCANLGDAFQSGNPFMMRHIMNFFKEIVDNPRTNHMLQSYNNFKDDLDYLIVYVKKEEKVNTECLSILFEFFTCLISLDDVDLELLFPLLINIALRWVRTPTISTDALVLLSSITSRLFRGKEVERDSDQRQEVIQTIFDVLEEQLAVILLLLESPDGLSGLSETYTKQTALLSFLSELVKVPKFTDKIMTSLYPDKIRQLFLPLKKPDAKDCSFFQQPVYTFFIQALLFIKELAAKETSWLLLYSELLHEKQLQLLLAIALYTGPASIKNKIFTLTVTVGFSAECIEALSRSMAEVNKLIIFSPNNTSNNKEIGEERNEQVPLISPALTQSQDAYVNSLIEKFEKLVNQSENIMTSSIMELYQFKIAAMEQKVQTMQTSQEAADQRATSLQHCLALTSAEVSRVHQFLLETQQNYETSKSECIKLVSQLSDVQGQLKEMNNKYSQIVQTLRSKTRIITELNDQVKDLNTNIDNKNQELNSLNFKNKSLNESLQESNNKIIALEKVKAELEYTNKEGEARSDVLKKELLSKAEALTKLEKENAKKDDEINKLNQELLEQKKMRELISDLVMGKKKLDK